MKLAPGARLGTTYRVVRRIGGGGMGDVYEVTHERLAGRYAAKVLSGDFASHPDAFTRFKREAMVTSGLRHPGIVQVIDFDRADEGHPYLVMELLEGEELATIIHRSAPLELPRALGIVEQIGSALEAAHRQGIVHRDLKPQNVFVVPLDRGRELVKILDFGISKAQVATQKLTRTAAVIGTPQYMAPEQAMGRGAEVDARADQFALAAIAYELLSGQPAFAGDSVVALIYQVINVDPPPLAAGGTRLPAAVDAAIRRGLAKQPAARYRDVGEFVAALFAAAGLSTPAPANRSGRVVAEAIEAPEISAASVGGTKKLSTTLSASVGQAHPAPRQGRRLVTTFLLLAVVISVAGTAIWIRSARRPDEASGLGGASARSAATSGAPTPTTTPPAPSSPKGAAPPEPAEPPARASGSGTATVSPPPATAAAPADDQPAAESTPEPPKPDRRRKRPPAKPATTRGATEPAHRDEMVHDL